jgi:uncharacterized protein with HEPN domain
MSADKNPQGYLLDLLERIKRIESYSAQGRTAFLASSLLQDAIMRNFEVMGEIVKRLDKSFTETYPTIPWRRIAGFRDVLIHDYEGVSMEVIWQVIERDLPVLHQSLQALIDSLPTDEDPS